MLRPIADASHTVRYGIVLTPLVDELHVARTRPGPFIFPSCALAGRNMAPSARSGTSTTAVTAPRFTRRYVWNLMVGSPLDLETCRNDALRVGPRAGPT